jgi:hypothetical protein
VSTPPSATEQDGESGAPGANPRSSPDHLEDERQTLPRPGDHTAVQQGCRCPTLANRPEAGASLTSLIAPDCAMHKPPDPGPRRPTPQSAGAPSHTGATDPTGPIFLPERDVDHHQPTDD